MSNRGSTYLNNAATSFPKPEVVSEAVLKNLVSLPVEPGRTGSGGDPLTRCRRELALLLGVGDVSRVVLLPSATHALNQVILGLCSQGGHAVSTDLEHNSVLRPLAHAGRELGAKVTYVAPGADGRVSLDDIAQALRDDTRIIAMTHASNVTGVIQPHAEVADLAARFDVPLLLDCAQSAGVLDISHDDLPGRVYLAVAGHKGLCGPAGTGALVVPDDQLTQTFFGGTGIHSERQEHPGELPLRHEAGTPNLSGLEGLAAGARWVHEQGVDQLGLARADLVTALREGLSGPDSPVVLFPREVAPQDARCGVVSFVVPEIEPREVGFALREAFGIEVRTGLHCAPRIHRSLQTGRSGTVRASFGAFNTLDDVDQLVRAVAEIAA